MYRMYSKKNAIRSRTQYKSKRQKMACEMFGLRPSGKTSNSSEELGGNVIK